MTRLRPLATLLFVLATPLFLITTNVGGVVSEPRLYTYGFDRYNIAAVTGIAPDQLERAAKQLRDYFNSDDELLDVRVELFGEERSLYNEREVLHMRDVKGLIRGVYWIQIATGAYLLLSTVVALVVARRHGARWVASALLGASLLTVGLVLAAGLVSLVAWRQLFLLFHRLSFTNNLWQLDPQRDFLLMMFPNGFFFDATLLIALATALEGILLALIAWRARHLISSH
jgi:integral membrane protein (TIGR01906 family)